MTEIRIYSITEEQFKNTEYRPLDVEIEEIETEDGWDYSDILEDAHEGYRAEKVVDVTDLIVWEITNFWDNEEPTTYVVELK